MAVDIVAAAVAAYSIGVWFPVARSGPSLQIIVHAGDVTVAPENSLEAILGAIRNGADGIEIDAAQSSDGTWWLMHSGEEISDTTTGTGRFSDLSDQEIASLRISGGVGYRPELGDLRIPRLAEVWNAVGSWTGTLQIDNTMLTEESAADLARQWSAVAFAGTKAVISRFPAGPCLTKAVDPTIQTLLISNPNPPDAACLDAWLAEASSISRPDVIALRPFEVQVYTYFDRYGEDEQQAIERAWRWGASTWLTWDLAEARKILNALQD